MPETETSIFDKAIEFRNQGKLGEKLQGLRDEAKGAQEPDIFKALAKRVFHSHQAGDVGKLCQDLQAAVDLGLEEPRSNDSFPKARVGLRNLRAKYLKDPLPIPVIQTGLPLADSTPASAESLAQPDVKARKLIDIVRARVIEADGYRDNTSMVIGPENADSFTEFIESLEFPGQISLTNVKMMRFRDGLSFGFQGLVERPGEKTSIVVMSRWLPDENFKAVISTAASDLATSTPSALTAEIEQSLSPDNLRSAVADALNQQIPPNWQVADFVVENGNLFLKFKKRESPLLATAASAETPPWSTEGKDSGFWDDLASRLGYRDSIEEILSSTGLREDQVRAFEAALRSGDPTVPVDTRWIFWENQLSNEGKAEFWRGFLGQRPVSQLSEEEKREVVEDVLPDFLRRYPREALAPNTSEFEPVAGAGQQLGEAVDAGPADAEPAPFPPLTVPSAGVLPGRVLGAGETTPSADLPVAESEFDRLVREPTEPKNLGDALNLAPEALGALEGIVRERVPGSGTNATYEEITLVVERLGVTRKRAHELLDWYRIANGFPMDTDHLAPGIERSTAITWSWPPLYASAQSLAGTLGLPAAALQPDVAVDARRASAAERLVEALTLRINEKLRQNVLPTTAIRISPEQITKHIRLLSFPGELEVSHVENYWYDGAYRFGFVLESGPSAPGRHRFYTHNSLTPDRYIKAQVTEVGQDSPLRKELEAYIGNLPTAIAGSINKTLVQGWEMTGMHVNEQGQLFFDFKKRAPEVRGEAPVAEASAEPVEREEQDFFDQLGEE